MLHSEIRKAWKYNFVLYSPDISAAEQNLDVCLDDNNAGEKIFMLEGDVESLASVVTSLNTLTGEYPPVVWSGHGQQVGVQECSSLYL